MPYHELDRRSFIKSGCLFAGGMSLPGFGFTEISAGSDDTKPVMKLGLDADVNNHVLLQFMKQIGVEWVCTSLLPTQGEAIDPLLTAGAVMTGFDRSRGGIGGPPAGLSGPWKEEEVKQLIDKVESAGLKLGSLYLHSFPKVILGNAGRDKDIEHVCESIRIAGRLKIPVLLYNFYGLRNVEGLYAKPGRGGATYRAFDEKLVKDNSALASLGVISEETMWKRMQYFLEAVIPVADTANVRLALHPNDPPVGAYRQIAQPFATIAQWKRMVNFLPNPANGIVFDTGVIGQLGGDPVELIRYFSKRDCINHVHFRNARSQSTGASTAYYETFIDEGAIDMPGAMKALKKSGYSRGIVPDHSPSVPGDTSQFGQWGYALGYIRALIQATGG